MTFKTYEINVDLVHDTSTTCSNRFSQNDRNSAKLLVTITNKGAEIDLSQAKSVRMSFKKPDGTRVFQNDCQPINAMKGKYQIVLKTQTLTAVGNVIAQIHIEEEDRIIDTQKFFFVVNDSLASDEAIESTNEFTIIQKAIEAGKKLEGVDINGIITAGVKADAALPKAGGTMTGALNVNAPLFIKSKDGVKQYSFETDANGKLWFTEKGTPKDIFTVETDGTFRVAGSTNLLKKTGDTMTGTLLMQGSVGFDGDRNIYRRQADGNFDKGFSLTEANVRLNDWKNKKVVWDFDHVSETFTVNSNTNLVKKSGDTLTGDLIINAANKGIKVSNATDGLTASVDSNGVYYWWASSSKIPLRYDIPNDTLKASSPSVFNNTATFIGGSARLVFDVAAQSVTFDQPTNQTSARGLIYREDGVTTGGIGRIRSTTDNYNYIGWGASPWDSASSLIVSDKVLKWKNKDVAMRDKDGVSNIPLTADAELIGPNGVIAVRRGNTVSLRAPIRRKAGSPHSAVLFTLPEGMRPVGFTVQQGIISTDGVSAIFTVLVSGEVTLVNPTATDVSGENFYVTCTYVVD